MIVIRQRLPVKDEDYLSSKSDCIHSVAQPVSDRADLLERDRGRESMSFTTLEELCYLCLHLFGESWRFSLEATLRRFM